MKFEDYERFILDYSNNGYQMEEQKRLAVLALGLAGESGEVVEKIKKDIRDGVKDDGGIALELGDVLAYLVLLADHYGFTLQDIVDSNAAKLRSRQDRKVQAGSGDYR